MNTTFGKKQESGGVPYPIKSNNIGDTLQGNHFN